jgi:hypothetical protein
MMQRVRADMPLMRSLSGYERVHTVSGLICWIDKGTVGLMLLARPYLLDGTVMVAETLGPTCLMHQLLALVSPSFVSCGLRRLDCLMSLVLMGTV